MTTSEELRAAAERVRDYDDGTEWASIDWDAKAVAQAYLASLPAWLPEGTLPDAEGWWLWAIPNVGTTPYEIRMNTAGHPFFVYDGYEIKLSEQVGSRDRFARWTRHWLPSPPQ